MTDAPHAMADAILALINSKPRTPTREDLAELLGRMLPAELSEHDKMLLNFLRYLQGKPQSVDEIEADIRGRVKELERAPRVLAKGEFSSTAVAHDPNGPPKVKPE